MADANSFQVPVAEWIGAAWSRASEATRKRLLQFAADRASALKDQELRKGLGVDGKPLLKRLHPRPDGAKGPPLTPHELASRSRKWLRASLAPKTGVVTLWWSHGWGAILGFHRTGIPSHLGPRVRDIIGLTPGHWEKLKAEVRAQWRLGPARRGPGSARRRLGPARRRAIFARGRVRPRGLVGFRGRFGDGRPPGYYRPAGRGRKRNPRIPG